MNRKDKLDIDRVAIIGRTYDEYAKFFMLDSAVLGRVTVLDCGGGVSSFAAEANRAGCRITACDPVYAMPVSDLIRRGEEDLAHVFDRFDRAAHLYTWSHYRDKEEIIACRRRALARFADDFPSGLEQGRYLAATLPSLPFNDKCFELVLCSHFLFLYHDRLDREFHRATLLELVRVAGGEVRVFPLQGLDAQPYPDLSEMLDWLAGQGIWADVVDVPFEFQKGSNQMLCLERKP